MTRQHPSRNRLFRLDKRFSNMVNVEVVDTSSQRQQAVEVVVTSKISITSPSVVWYQIKLRLLNSPTRSKVYK